MPKVQDGTKPPAGLVGAGLAEWRRLFPMLTAAGVMKDSDLLSLEDYCRAVMDLRRYEASAKKAGPELAIAKGFQGMVVKLRAQANQLRQQLGLTPSSRSAIKADVPPKSDQDDERFFGGPRGVVGGRATGT